MCCVSLSFDVFHTSLAISPNSEDLIRKENAIPTRAQRPTSPRRVLSPPPVSSHSTLHELNMLALTVCFI